MPQLAKGGKYVFGWSIISKDGGILLPEEARQEYQLNPGGKVILMPGSRTSGGFSIARKSVVEKSRLSDILTLNSDSASFQIEEGEIINSSDRILCFTTIHDNGQLLLTAHILKAYGVKPGDYLLAIHGSYIGVAMAVRGPLVEEAAKHPEIAVFIAGEG